MHEETYRSGAHEPTIDLFHVSLKSCVELQQIVSLFIGATICILVIDDVIISYLHRIIPAAIIPRELLGSRMCVSNNSSIHTNVCQCIHTDR